MELEQLSGIQLGRLVNRKEVSPTEVISYFMGRILARNERINAFTYTMFDDALHEAKLLEQKILSGETNMPFAGVPIALKDFLPSKRGWKNSHGGVEALIQTDNADSEFYSAASKLGAIAIGKTNAPAFGFSGACENKLYGATKNPFNTSRTSGGSSGGSAAAVADGLVSFAEGGDAGGSIRIPSGWCNLFGFKPSIGTVPSYCRPDGWAATHPYCFNGSLTKTVEDSAWMLNAMAQYNPRDPISLPINANKDFVDLMHKSVKGMKIAFTYDFDLYPEVSDSIKEAVYNTAKVLEKAGADVEPVKFNFQHTLHDIMFCWAWAISVDTALDLQFWKLDGLDLVKDNADQLPKEFIKFNEYASNVGILDMRKFNEIRTDILDNFEDVLYKYDAIVSPTAVCPPMPISWGGRAKYFGDKELDFISFAETPLANFVGYPAASVPAGMINCEGVGCPVGMQIIGRQYHDEDVFALSATVERLQPWTDNYPFMKSE